MISISKSIIINANQSIVWSFISDIPRLLLVNRFRKEINIPSGYNLNEEKKFVTTNNFGFGNVEMNAQVIMSKAPISLSFKEWSDDKKKVSYQHETSYSIIQEDNYSYLIIKEEGTFGTKVQDISFKPIISGIIQDELYRIKKYIESAEISSNPNSKKGLSPI